MVNDAGQIYTIEGLAAAILMVVTAYLVISTTTVLTPQDVHIIDMQLQQLGNDALAMMDTPDTYGNDMDRKNSTLVMAIATNNTTLFHTTFSTYLNSTTNTMTLVKNETLAYQAVIFYRANTTNVTNSFTFNTSPYYRENAVKISRWVYLPNFTNTPYPGQEMRNGTQSVLLEVLLWRI